MSELPQEYVLGHRYAPKVVEILDVETLKQQIEQLQTENRELDAERVDAIEERDKIALTLGYTSHVCKEYLDEVKQLTEMKSTYRRIAEEKQEQIEQLQSENTKMRECLEWYQDQSNFHERRVECSFAESETGDYYISNIRDDYGNRACECLSKLGSGSDA